MGKWTTELKSGKHKQAHRILKKGDSWCCIGLRAEIVEGIPFTLDCNTWIGPDGTYGMVSDETLDEWGLADLITDQEAIKITKLLARVLTKSWKEMEYVIRLLKRDNIQRSMLLAGMNDNGFTFEEIATVLEEMGWDNSGE